MSNGSVTLVERYGAMQLAIQATISNAIKNTDVISMFAKRQPQSLRDKLSKIQRDVKLGNIESNDFTQQSIEILTALKELGEKLSSTEETFLQKNMTDELKNFKK